MPASPSVSSRRRASSARLRDRVASVAAEARARSGGGTVSVWLSAAGAAGATGLTGATDGGVGVAADEPHYAASIMKLPLLVAAHREAAAGALALDEGLAVRNAFRSVADGTAYALDRSEDQDEETWDRSGGTASVGWLAEQATTRSGNLATNLLLERVGLPAVEAVLRDAGCSARSAVRRGLGDAVAREAGLDNVVTAADVGLVMRGVAAGTLASPATCAAVEAVLSRQVWRDGVPAGVPSGTYVANKTGWVRGVDHDVALVRPGRVGAPAYVLAVLTTLDLPEDEADAVVAAVSRAVWEEWTR